MTDDDPVQFCSIMSEAVIRQQIGGERVLKGQLEHLAALIDERPRRSRCESSRSKLPRMTPWAAQPSSCRDTPICRDTPMSNFPASSAGIDHLNPAHLGCRNDSRVLHRTRWRDIGLTQSRRVVLS
ncbi:Scr1 family TA system antitoxin-like transcriptional regulator [Saccharopolyspora hattusasensis]|uniref:Scr1 family TA system antitoxin-like transcriptional regulator n=1 Tax=Saccharopolyspora hattusasensis TaxID=1128679 RepID=UPI003D966FAE